jgi:hypothetical protein
MHTLLAHPVGRLRASTLVASLILPALACSQTTRRHRLLPRHDLHRLGLAALFRSLSVRHAIRHQGLAWPLS